MLAWYVAPCIYVCCRALGEYNQEENVYQSTMFSVFNLVPKSQGVNATCDRGKALYTHQESGTNEKDVSQCQISLYCRFN